MCQRAMIAMALASEPSLLIADEPTTGLDATIQSKIVDLLEELKAEIGITTLLISHDIGVIGRLSDRVAVMYGGAWWNTAGRNRCWPGGQRQSSLYPGAARLDPQRGRGAAKRNLQAIEGDVLDTINMPPGCRFYARCNRVTPAVRERCAHCDPELDAAARPAGALLAFAP